MKWKVPLTAPSLDVEEEAAAIRVLRSGWLSIGPEVEAFEREFAETLGSRYAIATANATDALALCYDAVGVDESEQVAMCALTFVASLNVALRRGEVPLLIDITSEDDLTMSVADLAEKISPSTRLVVTMPYGGFAPDMNGLMAVAAESRVAVIEDACHGLLGTYQGRQLGTIGAAGVFSFYANKNMTTGEGGMIVTNDRAIAERVRLMRNHGMTRTSHEHHGGTAQLYDVKIAGHNFRMDEIRAAIGRAQFRKLPSLNQRRRENSLKMRGLLSEACPELRIPFSQADQSSSAHHVFCAILPERCNRSDFMQRMADRGVQTSVHYRPLHRFSHTLGLWEKTPHLPVLERIENQIVTLPLGPDMTEEQILILVEAVKRSLF
jgi:dTDP-4-amino-4,6-dideoxygalactose transaminase